MRACPASKSEDAATYHGGAPPVANAETAPTKHKTDPDRERASVVEVVRPQLAVVLAAVLGLTAAWVATGSTGLMSHALRRSLMGFLLGSAIVAACPRRHLRWRPMALALVAFAIGLGMVASSLVPVNVLAVAVVLIGLASWHVESENRCLLRATEAVILLAVFRVMVQSIPTAWLAADALGGFLGRVASLPFGTSLWIGTTFAGLDFLVVMSYLACAITLGNREVPHRWRRCAMTMSLLIVTQLLLILMLDWIASNDWFSTRSVPQAVGSDPSSWSALLEATLKPLVPWNLLALFAMVYAVMAVVLLRSVRTKPNLSDTRSTRWIAFARIALVLGIANVLPFLATFSGSRPDLSGKTIVLFEKGFLNWDRPVHGEYGRLGQGMYGLLPVFLQSLGATPVRSPDLAEEDLRGADALVIIYPNDPWEPGQVERVLEFVRGGGSLLLLGEHTVLEKVDGQLESPGENRINDLLKPTAMRVRFDSGMFAVGGWLQSYEALAHPTHAGIADDQNQFGVVIGATVETRFPAHPLLVGRWGWADPGVISSDENDSLMGNGIYDPGEKLGDLVLAAEQRLGSGKVVVFGDTSGFTNGLTVGCHEYTSRLFAYLLDATQQPISLARQLTAIALGAIGLLLLLWRPTTTMLAAFTIVLAVSLVLCARVTAQRAEVLPDRQYLPPATSPEAIDNLAYIDNSHLGAFSGESWRVDGTMGLALTLVRSGYLTLGLPEITEERLRGAGLLVSVASGKPYDEPERKVIRNFVETGGIFILTVGHDSVRPSRALLEDFGFRIGDEPLGHFKVPFFDSGDAMNYVRFHAAWHVHCDDPEALVIAQDVTAPLIVIRRIGEGLVMVVGDSNFATNQNLERESGEPFEGMRENAVFWRYALSLLREGVGERKVWYPPAPEKDPTAVPSNDDSQDERSQDDDAPKETP